MTQAIFRSTAQALHFSYLVEFLPASHKSQMQAMIEAHMKACGIWDEPRAIGTINFSGLSPEEVRGQCAMVRGAAEHHLVPPELLAIKAHYGEKYTRADGVRGLAGYAEPQLSVKGDAALALAWGVFAGRRRQDGLALRDIAGHYGLSLSTAQRDQSAIKRLARALLVRGTAGLDGLFRQTGLVADEVGECAC